MTSALATAALIEPMPFSPAHLEPVLAVPTKVSTDDRAYVPVAFRAALLNLLG